MRKANEIEVQNLLIKKIQDCLPPNCSLAEELSDLLEISTDSVYRRLRNETLFSISETAIMCKHYTISFDSIVGNDSNSASVNFSLMRNETDFINHMKFMLEGLDFFKHSPNGLLTYAAIDIPIFHHFQFKELTAFKMFYWLKSVINEQRLANKKFEVDLITAELMDVCLQTFQVYRAIPSIEIWTDATINSIIKQIEFYWESGMFANKNDALLICKQCVEEITVIQHNAEISSKSNNEDNFKLYFSEIEIGNNCILASSDIVRRAYLSYNTINLLVTAQVSFCNETDVWLQNLIKKSTLISGASEKIRYQFFKRAIDNIQTLEQKILE